MTQIHDELYAKANEAIKALFSDTSVSPEQTKESLQTLMYEMVDMVDTL